LKEIAQSSMNSVNHDSYQDGLCCLCSLPLETLKGIFEFLSPFEIAVLDSSMTNKIHRKRFLEALDGSSISTLTFFTENGDDEQGILWFISKRIVLPYLELQCLHPCYLELFERTHKKISKIGLDIFNLEAGSLLYSWIGMCGNLTSLTLNCPITDGDLQESLKNMKHLKCLEFYCCCSLTFASLETILKCCPQLESLAFHDVPWVTDEYLKAILEGLHNLNNLSLSDVNISDQSLSLIVKTNRLKEIVYWYDCREVSWEGRLFYLREIHLPQLLSEDEEQQLRGLRAFLEMIGFNPNDGWIRSFPIDQYVSLGLFSRIREIISKLNEESFHQSQFVISALCFFDVVVMTHYFDHILDSTDLLINLNLTRSFTNDEYWSSLTEGWLQFFMKIAGSHSEYLISLGILSKLMKLQQEGQLVRHSFHFFFVFC
jgi:hypothetical protein